MHSKAVHAQWNHCQIFLMLTAGMCLHPGLRKEKKSFYFFTEDWSVDWDNTLAVHPRDSWHIACSKHRDFAQLFSPHCRQHLQEGRQLLNLKKFHSIFSKRFLIHYYFSFFFFKWSCVHCYTVVLFIYLFTVDFSKQDFQQGQSFP